LVRFLAEKKPDYSFVFIGKIDETQNGLPRYKNTYYLPVQPYEELYKFSKFFDVTMLPFNINELTKHSNPLKILEYLASGKPVVSINIPEVLKYKDNIHVASSYEDFLKGIEQYLEDRSEASVIKRMQFASQHSWEKRFDEIQNIIFCPR